MSDEIILHVNGKRVRNARISIAYGNAGPTPPADPKPPVDNKPPSHPVEPKPPAGVTIRPLGPLTKTSSGRRVTLNGGQTVAWSFVVPSSTTVALVNFNFAPQNDDPVPYRLWLSEKPGGAGLDRRYGNDTGNKKRGDALGVAAAIKGRGAERRGAAIETDKTYYLNLKAGGGVHNVLSWGIGGNFRG